MGDDRGRWIMFWVPASVRASLAGANRGGMRGGDSVSRFDLLDEDNPLSGPEKPVLVMPSGVGWLQLELDGQNGGERHEVLSLSGECVP